MTLRIPTVAIVACLLSLCLVRADLRADDDSKTKTVKLKDVTLDVPASWKQTDPSSRFRVGQFEIPAVKGDDQNAELVVYYFGAFGGGGVDANVKRWIGQFQPKDRKAKVTAGQSPQGKYWVVDVTGTYNKPIGPPVLRKTKPMPGARMLSVILAVKEKGQYFLKFTGSEKTVSAAAADFRKSFGGAAKKEKEYSSSDE